MNAIFEKARAAAPPSKAVARYGAGSLRTLLATFCRELQQYQGGASFYLTGRDAGPLLGVSDVQAWRWLHKLVADEIIKPIKTYPKGVRKATEYRYVGE